MNKIKIVPAYLCIVLFVSNCAGANPQVNESRPNADSGSTEQTGSFTAEPTPRPQQLMAAVKRAYTDLTFYRSKGIHRARQEFRGRRVENAEIPFEIEYTRGQSATLKWNEADHEKELRIVGKDSWVEVDGKRTRTFSNPDDALGIAGQTDNRDYLFEITFFVFRDEMGLGDKFFIDLDDPETTGEESVDGHECYVLTGIHGSADTRHTYWIDKESAFIRRIESVLVIRTMSEGKEYVSTSTTTENYTDIELGTGRPVG